ncbi:MAG: sulfotransferase [Myxococcota bacterium]
MSELHPRAAGLVERAHGQTGLELPPDPAWLEALDVLVRAIEEEATLHTLGERIVYGRIERLLVSRLRVEDWYRRHPELGDETVRAPIFVIGLPRTGTTALSQILAQDPRIRSLRVWESGAPVPPPDSATELEDPRIAACQKELDALYAAFPDFRAMHYEEATGATECQDLLGMAFRTAHFDGMAHIPSYTDWVLGCDMVPAYRMHHRVLGLLQSHCPPRLWQLKTPLHLLFLDVLNTVYPDARFVVTHRDPALVIPSVCSLVATLWGMVSESVPRRELGRRQVALWSEALRRGLAFRGRAEASRFVDVQLTDLLREPLRTLERVYAILGLELDAPVRDRLLAWIRAHPRGEHGEHRYDPEDFALDRDEIRERFSFYSERFAPGAEAPSSR